MWLLGTKGADRTKTLPCPNHEASVAPRRDGRTELEVLSNAFVKTVARVVRPVLWPRRSSESQSASVPSENLILLSEKREKEPASRDRESIGFQMRELLASLKGRRLTA
jgi:hypothetical protein